MAVNVVCVKVGTKYPSNYVNRLACMVRRNLKQECWFSCVTENPDGITEPMAIVPPPKGLPGWWAKLGLFQAKAFGEITGRILYLDLDVVVTGNLDDLVNYPTRFAMHRDFTRPLVNASAVIVLDSGAAEGVWYTFCTHPTKYVERHRAGGDQEFITKVHPAVDLLPMRWVVSYKREAQVGPPPDARVVCFHGVPKPHDCAGWVRTAWG